MSKVQFELWFWSHSIPGADLDDGQMKEWLIFKKSLFLADFKTA